MDPEASAGIPAARKPLRLWPGLVAVVLLLIARFGVKAVVPGFRGFSLGMMWSFGAAAVVLLWWAFFSRTRWFERLGAIVLMVGGLGGAWLLRHESMGPLWVFGYAVPGLCLALVAAAAATRRLADGPRRVTMAAALLLAGGAWTLVRTDGISGDHAATFGWRWAKSPEERLLARAGEPKALPSAPVVEAPKVSPSDAAVVDAPKERIAPQGREEVARVPPPSPGAKPAGDWPGFRGPGRDGVARGVRIATDWAASPPAELWRRPIGPGWSSFAARGNLIYTQEQRGDDEIVSCYDAATGAEVWTHGDAARFFESNAGAGPRGTPTLAGDRVYTLGATGILNALDAGDGALAWTRNAAADTKATLPDWGFSSSPLVVEDLVIVAVGGQLAAYDRATGEARWTGAAGGVSYSSPQLATIDGVPQVLLLNGSGAVSVAPADGTVLWEHAWRGFPIVQPALVPEGDVLISAGGEGGIRRLALAQGPGGWTVERRWGSAGLKPYFNDFVIHDGHVFGFDGRILACLDLETGERKWKGGRYGNGQLVVLPEQDLLLVLSEDGEIALVAARPDGFSELARFPALEGKTWNHPALVGDVLLARNGQEMAAFRLPLAR